MPPAEALGFAGLFVLTSRGVAALEPPLSVKRAFLVSKITTGLRTYNLSICTAAASAFTSDGAYLQKLNGMWLIWLLEYAIILPTIGAW